MTAVYLLENIKSRLLKPFVLFSLLYTISFGTYAQRNVTTLEVISYNIHHGANKDEVLKVDQVGAFLRDLNVDLVGLQEVDNLCNRSAKTGKYPNI